MLALEDYDYNGPVQLLGFSPKIQKDNFEGFFTSATARGNIIQKRTATQQINTVKVAYGSLHLKQLQSVFIKQPKHAEVISNGVAPSKTYTIKDNRITVSFDETELLPDQNITVTLAY